MNRAEKETEVASIRESLAQARGVVLASLKGLSVTEVTELRVQLHEAGPAEETQSFIHPSGVASIWARRKIGSLLDEKLVGADEVQVKAKVLSVALEHSLLSPYTSFVAVEERVSRPKGTSLRSEALPNTQPKGQSMQQLTYPKTATTAPANIFLGGLFLFLMLITHVMRQPEADEDADKEA
jgi:hypothetical protein